MGENTVLDGKRNRKVRDRETEADGQNREREQCVLDAYSVSPEVGSDSRNPEETEGETGRKRERETERERERD